MTGWTPWRQPPTPAPAPVEMPSEPDPHAELVAQNCELANRLAVLGRQIDRLTTDVGLLEQENALLRRQLAQPATAKAERDRRNCVLLADALAWSEARVGAEYAPLAEPARARELVDRLRVLVRSAVVEELGLERVR